MKKVGRGVGWGGGGQVSGISPCPIYNTFSVFISFLDELNTNMKYVVFKFGSLTKLNTSSQCS